MPVRACLGVVDIAPHRQVICSSLIAPLFFNIFLSSVPFDDPFQRLEALPLDHPVAAVQIAIFPALHHRLLLYIYGLVETL